MLNDVYTVVACDVTIRPPPPPYPPNMRPAEKIPQPATGGGGGGGGGGLMGWIAAIMLLGAVGGGYVYTRRHGVPAWASKATTPSLSCHCTHSLHPITHLPLALQSS